MTDGINLTGFNELNPAATIAIDASGDYSPATGAAASAADVSNQATAQGPK
jgi:hypothetical protein